MLNQVIPQNGTMLTSGCSTACPGSYSISDVNLMTTPAASNLLAWMMNSGSNYSIVVMNNTGSTINWTAAGIVPSGTVTVTTLNSTNPGDSNEYALVVSPTTRVWSNPLALPAYSLTTIAWSTSGSTTITVMPSSLTYTSQVVGTTSAAQPVTIQNTGTNIVNFSSFALTGTNAGDYAINSNTCGSTLAVSASCVVNITFTPTAAGTRTASLTITDNASGSPQSTTITGTGASCTNNASTDPASLQALVNAGGTVTGQTCNLGGSIVTIANALTFTNNNITGNDTTANLIVNANNVTMSGNTFSHMALAFGCTSWSGGGCASFTPTNQQQNIVFTGNTIQHLWGYTNVYGAAINFYNIEKNRTFTGNTISDIWYGGYANTNNSNVSTVGPIGGGFFNSSNQGLLVHGLLDWGGWDSIDH